MKLFDFIKIKNIFSEINDNKKFNILLIGGDFIFFLYLFLLIKFQDEIEGKNSNKVNVSYTIFEKDLKYLELIKKEFVILDYLLENLKKENFLNIITTDNIFLENINNLEEKICLGKFDCIFDLQENYNNSCKDSDFLGNIEVLLLNDYSPFYSILNIENQNEIIKNFKNCGLNHIEFFNLNGKIDNQNLIICARKKL